jgi:hypothetical protein
VSELDSSNRDMCQLALNLESCVAGADAKIRDYSGRLPEYYLKAREQKERKDIRSEYNGSVKHGKLTSNKPSFRLKSKPPTDRAACASVQYPSKVLFGSYQPNK